MMALKFCMGAPNVSASYAVANIHLMIRMFIIISISGIISTVGKAQPIIITVLVLVLLSAIVQVRL